MYDLSVYNADFYEEFGWEGREMAPWLLPLIRSVQQYWSFVDVGCGEGHYLRWLLDHGFNRGDVLGIEGSPAALERAVRPSSFEKDSWVLCFCSTKPLIRASASVNLFSLSMPASRMVLRPRL